MKTDTFSFKVNQNVDSQGFQQFMNMSRLLYFEGDFKLQLSEINYDIEVEI